MTMALLGACSGGVSDPVTSCSTDAGCPAGARCLDRACVADAPPTADVIVPAPIEENAIAAFDGSRSSDADPGDAVSSYSWTFAATDAPCDPPEVTSTDPIAHVRFACAGRYSVTLVTTDTLGVSSAPFTSTFDVSRRSGDPLVVVGGDVAVDHECRGDVCSLLGGAVHLTATVSDPSAAGVSFSWTVRAPPSRPLDETRRVTFAPSPDVASPAVLIETDAAAISGDWLFDVVARDAAGVLGAGVVRVSVRNRAPTLVAYPSAEYAHEYDASTRTFHASGAVPFVATDPDGDPLAFTVTWRHAGDGDATFTGDLLDSTATFAVSVPFAVADDALKLIGAAGLTRSVDIRVVDVNGDSQGTNSPIVIANRPPEPAGATSLVKVDHAFDASGGRYVARAQLGAWADPDHDPLVSASEGAGPCSGLSMDGSVLVADCASPYTGTPGADGITGTYELTTRVADPWTTSLESPVVPLEIRNRPPVIVLQASGLGAKCSDTGCCLMDRELGVCETPEVSVTAGSYTVVPEVSDPDGDPLTVTTITASSAAVTPSAASCTGSSCGSFLYTQDAVSSMCTEAYHGITLLLTDGLAHTAASLHTPGC